jgi:hypothetical protein
MSPVFRRRAAALLLSIAAVTLTPSVALAAGGPTDKAGSARDDHQPYGTGVGRKVG